MAATSTSDRYHLLDALRGFALLGIVIANYPVMAFWIFMDPEQQAALPFSVHDPLLKDLEHIFIQGKFYSIFSMLFGIGFGIFLTRGTTMRFLRRMVVLALIGWIHLRFFWEGDILLLYALIGLTLPLFNKLRDRWLLPLAAMLLLVPILLEHLIDTGAYALPERLWKFSFNALQGTGIDDKAYVNGGLHEFLTYRSAAWLARVAHVVGDHRPFKVLALFLIGLFIARRRLFRDPEKHRGTLRAVFLIGLPGLVPTYFAATLPPGQYVTHTALLAMGTAPLALSIAAAFALIWTRERGRRILHILSPAGRMALTNYLGQTFIGQSIFSGVGLALATRIGLGAIFPIAIAVFIAQVIFSHWWLARFQFGPFEWLWRVLTYGRYMSLRRPVAAPIEKRQPTELAEP